MNEATHVANSEQSDQCSTSPYDLSPWISSSSSGTDSEGPFADIQRMGQGFAFTQLPLTSNKSGNNDEKNSAGFRNHPNRPHGPDEDDSSQPSSSGCNILIMSRIGLETVQKITVAALEIFQLLGQLKLPSSCTQPEFEQNWRQKVALNEALEDIEFLFCRLRRIYRVCDETRPDDDNPLLKTVDVSQVLSLSPESELPAEKGDDHGDCEADSRPSHPHPHPQLPPQPSTRHLQILLEEKKALVELLTRKNKQIKEHIDLIRGIMYELTSAFIYPCHAPPSLQMNLNEATQNSIAH